MLRTAGAGPAADPPRGGSGRWRSSIRHKLLAMALLPLLGVLPLLAALLLWWGNVAFDRLLITKVRSDLAVAHGYFDRVLGAVGAGTAAVADSHALHLALADPGADWPSLLDGFRRREHLDFLMLRAADGTLRADSSGRATALPGAPGLASHIAADGTPRTSIEVVGAAELAELGPALRSRVPVPLVETRNAAQSDRTVETRAMLLLSTQPVRDAGGRLLGHLQGGMLVNRNLDFIDHVNAIVYPEGSLPFGSQGTATIFLDDVRISTNVRLFGGERADRAIGTRVSSQVRDEVLGAGRTWLDSAFVVNDWYVSAYEPLVDGSGRAVGMLYVGFLEQPFTLLKTAALASIALVFTAVMIVSALVSLRWARTIFRPLERMATTMRRVETGDLAARVGAVGPPGHPDEIARLAGHLDQLLEVIDDKTQSLQRLNAELDAKVAERTRQLAETQAHLVRSEKLAAVGQLTASIAHEVNNPIAVIQGNLDLVRELLDPAAAAVVRTELALVDEQVERMRLIVTQLLQFARPTEFAGYVEPVGMSRLVDDCLVLVKHLLTRTGIAVQRRVETERCPQINRQELQQVLVNLLVNAIHAMDGGGTLTITATDHGDPADGGVEIAVADTGTGLDPGLLAELFQPFVSRKKDGTGLGLWISRNLVERYGGDIVAANRSDGIRGAVFSVRLLGEPATPSQPDPSASRP